LIAVGRKQISITANPVLENKKSAGTRFLGKKIDFPAEH